MATAYVLTEDGLASIADDLLRNASSNSDDADRLIFVISLALAQDIPLPAVLRNWLAEALGEISRGEDPRCALGIARKRGERRSAASKNTEIAAWVALERASGKTLDDAIASVLEKRRGLSEDTARAAWQKYGGCIELNPGGQVAFFTEQPKPRKSK